jgi:hypothetical protein
MQKIGQHYKIEVRDTERGFGVFASEHVPSGSLIETSPGIIISQEFLNVCHYVATAEGMKPEEIVLDQYGLGWTPGKVFFPLGWVGVYNHSDSPNAEFSIEDDYRLLSVKSIREIPSGEEIFVSYGPNWWAKKPFLQKI